MSDYLVPHSQEPIGILYRDEHLLFVAKPHFLLSVPGKHPLNKDCLISRLQQTYPNARIVHRLDLDTSGTMVIALGKERHAELSRQFRLRQVAKSYIAVVAGEMRDYQAVEVLRDRLTQQGMTATLETSSSRADRVRARIRVAASS